VSGLWSRVVQEFQAEMQRKELEVAAVKTKADDILRGHSDDCPGYKELKAQKRRLGMWRMPFHVAQFTGTLEMKR